jgi:siroheme synthase-like protein
MKDREHRSGYYPVFLNISGRKCVVVGGGQVAQRKVAVLLRHGARVTVVCPDIDQGLKQLAESGEIRVLNREYRMGDLENAFVAIAATDNERTNRLVVEEARRQRVLVNLVDNARGSDFIVSSYLCRGDIVIAVSTSGRSPALARKIRTRLEKEFGAEYASLAQLVDEVRSQARQCGVELDGDTWQDVLDVDAVVDALKDGNRERARTILVDNLERATKSVG